MCRRNDLFEEAVEKWRKKNKKKKEKVATPHPHTTHHTHTHSIYIITITPTQTSTTTWSSLAQYSHLIITIHGPYLTISRPALLHYIPPNYCRYPPYIILYQHTYILTLIYYQYHIPSHTSIISHTILYIQIPITITLYIPWFILTTLNKIIPYIMTYI